MSWSQSSSAASPIVPVLGRTTAADSTTLAPSQWPAAGKQHQHFDSAAEDSGCISSASADLVSAEVSCIIDSSAICPTISEEVQQKPQPEQESSPSACFDSGIISHDQDDDSMHVDTKAGCKEWSCSQLLIDDCNNLSKAAAVPVGSTAQSLTTLNPMILKEYMSLWRVCYIQDEYGDTQLHLSILGKMSKAISNIIRLAPQKQLFDLRNDDGQCGMHLAVVTSQPDVIRQLRTFGAETCVRDHSGNTPLHLACINNDLSCVQALTDPISADDLKQFTPRADCSVRNYHGEYCVHIAARGGHIDILRQLVHACNVNLNEREGHNGNTPLHIASQSKQSALIEFLLTECEGKVDLETRNYARRTAFQLAKIQDDCRVMQVLAGSGAQPLDVSSDEEDTDEDFASDDEMCIGTPVACV